MDHKIVMTLLNETPGAVRYQEVDESGVAVKMANAKVGTQYLRKAQMDKPYPTIIYVHISDKAPVQTVAGDA